MSNTKGRAARLRAIAAAILIAGIVAAFLVGAVIPANVVTIAPGLPNAGVTVTSFVSTTDSGDGSFNWLFALLVLGPSATVAAMLYATSELASALRRSGRGRPEESTVTSGTEAL